MPSTKGGDVVFSSSPLLITPRLGAVRDAVNSIHRISARF
ncbi:hypothetical protein CKA32_005810 [Geitlerinema sp. FC II]|nr:hypothetical protein CKA32_005810 [Geitlerinema sp. FC II]